MSCGWCAAAGEPLRDVGEPSQSGVVVAFAVALAACIALLAGFGDAVAVCIARIAIAPGALPRKVPLGGVGKPRAFVPGEVVACRGQVLDQKQVVRLPKGYNGIVTACEPGGSVVEVVFPLGNGTDIRFDMTPGSLHSVAPPVRITYDPRSGAFVSAVVVGVTDQPPQRWILWLVANGQPAHEAAGGLCHMLRDIGTPPGEIAGMVVEFPGFAGSTGAPRREPDLIDAAAAARRYLISERAAQPDRIVLGGFSLGGSVACVTAAREQHPGLVVADRTFTRIAHVPLAWGSERWKGPRLRAFAESVCRGLGWELDAAGAVERWNGDLVCVYHKGDSMIPHPEASLAHRVRDRTSRVLAVTTIVEMRREQGDAHNAALRTDPEAYGQVLGAIRQWAGAEPRSPANRQQQQSAVQLLVQMGFTEVAAQEAFAAAGSLAGAVALLTGEDPP
eukprot:TRINITY_DN28357_c1_g1_i1.p1 TRINITY_DN28357_c1_g1~~TRINITY_DN28357_c1_g1_i1.p1  ORF type:complete len:447 (+),score=98.35 TRINITY_DN28357_c1_g1_i1:408-1748(+)